PRREGFCGAGRKGKGRPGGIMRIPPQEPGHPWPGIQRKSSRGGGFFGPFPVFFSGSGMSGIEELGRQALADIAAAATPEALEALRVSLLGKSGSITAQLKSLGALPGDQRKAAGEAINKVRDTIGAALSARKVELED